MLVLTTTNPEFLDEAVLDRMDELIFLELPEKRERERILWKRFNMKFKHDEEYENGVRVHTHTHKHKHKHKHNTNRKHWWSKKDTRIPISNKFLTILPAAMSHLSLDVMTKGCSGRELEKLVQGLSNDVYGNFGNGGEDKIELTFQVFNRVVEGTCEALKKKWELNSGSFDKGGKKKQKQKQKPRKIEKLIEEKILEKIDQKSPPKEEEEENPEITPTLVTENRENDDLDKHEIRGGRTAYSLPDTPTSTPSKQSNAGSSTPRGGRASSVSDLISKFENNKTF